MSEGALAITGLGAVTPVGLSAAATCTALRAGLSRMIAFEGWTDNGEGPPEEIIAGRVPLEWFDGGPQEEWPGHERWNLKPPRPHLLVSPGAKRLAEIAPPAAEEAWHAAGTPAGRVGLYLGLAEGDRVSALAETLAHRLGVTFDVVRGDCLGRAAGLAALHRAARHLREDRVDVAVVGGVDSLIRRAAIERMTADGQLRTEAVPHGIIPGEAAAFLVLERPGGPEPLAWLQSSAVAEEAAGDPDAPNQGVGLTKALRRARAGAQALTSRPLIVCDLNGERYRTLEWGLASVRALGDLHAAPDGPGSGDLWHPADCIGDTGAASGALAAMWAVTAMRKGYAHADRTLLWGASDGTLRAAAVLAMNRKD